MPGSIGGLLVRTVLDEVVGLDDYQRLSQQKRDSIPIGIYCMYSLMAASNGRLLSFGDNLVSNAIG